METIKKGDHIYAEWFECYPSSLAGAQMKLGATKVQLTGFVKHIRGDHPTNPTDIRLFIDTDEEILSIKKTDIGCSCGHSHIAVKPEWVKRIL